MATSKAQHSEYFDKAKEKYSTGKWNKKMLLVLVAGGKITEDEYKEIVGEDGTGA